MRARANKGADGVFFTIMAFGLYFLLGAGAMIFQGGHVPYWIDLGNGETVVAYTNGIIYTNPPAGMGKNKRTLWQEKDGSITSSVAVMGPGNVYNSYPIPATLEEIAMWNRVQEILRGCTWCIR